jgi:Fur family transcriptional regulator, ferric uptake regulator
MATLQSRVEEVLATLRAHAKRVTLPKRAVVDVLVSADEHLTAEDVTRRVQAQRPEVSPSTVYRILEELDDLGLVVHSHTGHGAAVYHLAGVSHSHLTCESCQTTFEVPDGIFDRLADELLEHQGFELNRHHVALSGLCAQCRPLEHSTDVRSGSLIAE